MAESFRTHRQIGMPRDRLSLIDCLPPQATKLLTSAIIPCRKITSVNLCATTLFLALDITTGEVTGLCKPGHRHQEFLALLKQM